MMSVRRYEPGEAGQLVALFHETVRSVNARDYTPGQIEAWVGGEVDLQAWDKRFQDSRTLIAQTEQGLIIGFANIDDNGYLDMLYVHRDHQHEGVATTLCDALERYAASRGVNKVVTHASLTARSFFEQRGYTTVREQCVERLGVTLPNVVMDKWLDADI